jgi:hypothetical protein
VVDVIREVARRDVRSRRAAGHDYEDHGPGSSGTILAEGDAQRPWARNAACR